MAGMGEQPTAAPRAAWPARLTGVLFGAACGMSVNALSDDFGYAGAAAGFGLAAVVSAVLWLRRLPAHAPLPRHVTRALLAAAFAVTVTAAVRPGWASAAVVAAAVLAVVAVAVVTDRVTVFRLVAGVVIVAFAIALAGGGAAVITRGEPAPGALLAATGVLMVPVGWYLSAVLQPIRDTAVGLGLICLVAAAGAAADGLPVLGVAFAGGGVALLVRRPAVRGAAAVVAGAGLVATGASFAGRDALPAAAVVLAGVAVAGGGLVATLPATGRWWARLTGRRA
jgi:hypothetical protein